MGFFLFFLQIFFLFCLQILSVASEARRWGGMGSVDERVVAILIRLRAATLNLDGVSSFLRTASLSRLNKFR